MLDRNRGYQFGKAWFFTCNGFDSSQELWLVLGAGPAGLIVVHHLHLLIMNVKATMRNPKYVNRVIVIRVE